MGISVTEDEADKKARGEGWDPLAIKNKDPKFHYRWLNKNSRTNMNRKTDYLGYEVVSGTQESVLADNTRMKKGSDVTSNVEIGDMILARIPREKHEEYRRANMDKIKRRTAAAAAAYRDAIRRASGEQLGYEEHRDNPTMRDVEDKK